MTSYKSVSLIETVFLRFNCKSISDLKHLSAKNRLLLAKEIEEHVPVNAASLMEYNEVLHIVLGLPPESSTEEAREKILTELKK